MRIQGSPLPFTQPFAVEDGQSALFVVHEKDATVFALEHGPAEEYSHERHDWSRAERRKPWCEQLLTPRTLLSAEIDHNSNSDELQLKEAQCDGLSTRESRVTWHHPKHAYEDVIHLQIMPEQ